MKIDKIKNMARNIPKKKLIIIVVVIIAIVGIIFARVVTKKKNVSAQNSITSVKTINPSINSISTTVEYSCQLKPIKQVDISPKTAGKVASLKVDVGSSVSSGQVLFNIDSQDLQAQVNQQQASLDAANANLAKTQGSSVDQSVAQAEQTLQSAEVTYNDALDYYNKMQSLYNSGAESEQDLETAQTKYQSAKVALAGAQSNFNIVSGEVGPQSVQAAQAQVKQSEASVESAKVQLSNATITTPISGTVSVVNVKQGEMTPTGSTSITVIDTSSMDAEVNVPDNMLSKIKVGDSVQLKVNSLSDKKINGTIYNISPAADSKTQSYIVKIKVDNSDGSLKPGMFTKVELPNEKVDNALTVPVEAITTEDGVSYIYKVSNGKVKKVSVTPGLSDGKITEIKSNNIYKDDDIITEGQLFLGENQRVKMVK